MPNAEFHRMIVIPRVSNETCAIEDGYEDMLTEFSTLPLFFVSSAILLKNLVRPFTEELEVIVSRDRALKGQVSTKKELYKMASGEAVSLNMALRLDRSAVLVSQHGTQHFRANLELLPSNPLRPLTTEFVAESLTEWGSPLTQGDGPHTYRVPSLGIVPCLHVPIVDQIRRIHERSGKTRKEFSRAIFGNAYEGAFEQLIYRNDRQVRVTYHTALRVARRAMENFGSVPGLDAGDFLPDALFKLDPKTKKSEFALSPTDGNVVPNRSDYLSHRSGRRA